MLLSYFLLRVGVFLTYAHTLWNVSSFMTACLTNDVEKMKEYGKSATSLQMTSPDGMTVLHAVVVGWKDVGGNYGGHREAFNLLISMMKAFGAKMDSQKPLTRYAQIPTFKKMLNKKAGPDQVSPVTLAILAGHWPLVYLLQEMGAITSETEMTVSITASISSLPSEDQHYRILDVTEFRKQMGRIVSGMKFKYMGATITVIKARNDTSFLVQMDKSIEVRDAEMTGKVSPADRMEHVPLAYEYAMKTGEKCDFPWGSVSCVTLYTVMRALPRDENVQQTASRVLVKMIKSSIAEGKTSEDVVFAKENIEQYIRTLANAVHLHSRNSLITQHAFEAMQALFQYETTSMVALKTALEKGVINVAFDALRFHHNDLDISRSATTLVQILLDECSKNQLKMQEAIKNGGINHLFYNLHWNWKISYVMIPLLKSLVLLTDTVVMTKMTADHIEMNEVSIHGLLSALCYYQKNSEITTQVIKILKNIVAMPADLLKKVLSENRLWVVELIVRILSTSSDQEVCATMIFMLSSATTQKIAKKTITVGLFRALERVITEFRLLEDVKMLVLNLAKSCSKIVVLSEIIEVLEEAGIEMIMDKTKLMELKNAQMLVSRITSKLNNHMPKKARQATKNALQFHTEKVEHCTTVLGNMLKENSDAATADATACVAEDLTDISGVTSGGGGGGGGGSSAPPPLCLSIARTTLCAGSDAETPVSPSNLETGIAAYNKMIAPPVRSVCWAEVVASVRLIENQSDQLE